MSHPLLHPAALWETEAGGSLEDPSLRTAPTPHLYKKHKSASFDQVWQVLTSGAQVMIRRDVRGTEFLFPCPTAPQKKNWSRVQIKEKTSFKCLCEENHNGLHGKKNSFKKLKPICKINHHSYLYSLKNDLYAPGAT